MRVGNRIPAPGVLLAALSSLEREELSSQARSLRGLEWLRVSFYPEKGDPEELSFVPSAEEGDENRLRTQERDPHRSPCA